MKKKIIIGLVLLLAVFGIYQLFAGKYNSMVELSEPVGAQWGKVQSAYQRRADLIPNLVNTVKGYAEFEKSTLTAVTEARAKATGVTFEASDLSPENIKKFQAAQDQLSGALSRLLVSMERYPDLKANENFIELQAQLEGTENRINVERNRYNDLVKEYNVYIRLFPNNLVAGLFWNAHQRVL
jgi:LemA protein